MWPLMLDMTKEESMQNLRNLELESYSLLVSALRAQGPLTNDKRKLLKETSGVLNITQERHKAEVRRAINDEKLNTIAYHVTGHTESSEDWAQEGRRLVPLLPRTAPQTAFSTIADDAAESAGQSNKQMPSPSSTERKRQSVAQMSNVALESNKSLPFRIPDQPKADDSKKRKITVCSESSSLAQHLLAPKLCRIQQLYRQRSKPKTKDISKKSDPEQIELIQHRIIQPIHQQTGCSSQPIFAGQKVNVLQNISLQPIKEELIEEEVSSNVKTIEQVQSLPACSNENQAPRPKLISNVKPNCNITIKQTSLQSAGPSCEGPKTIKMAATKKSITKTVNSGQKLIVVSNAQTIPSNSILQRTLQIPFVKNVSIKNFEKFKIVTSNSTPTSIQVTNVTNSGVNPVKHKVVTVKTNPTTKKVIPLSQLQVLNSKGSIKVLPLGGKIVGKSMATTSSPLYIVNTTQPFTKSTSTSQIITSSKIQSEENRKIIVENNVNDPNSTNSNSANRENGKSSVLAEILKASGVISEEPEDYDTKIEEFHIPQNKMSREKESELGEPSATIKEEILESDGQSEVPSFSYAQELNLEAPTEAIEMTETKQEHVEDKMDTITNEVIECENILPQEEIAGAEARCDITESVYEAMSYPVVLQADCLKSSDIESN